VSISSNDAIISAMVRSRLCLPKLKSPPATLLEFLSTHFRHIPEITWRDRMARGLVTNSSGLPLREDTPYSRGLTVFYVREVPFEPASSETETILYQDDEILVADKPHGMPVTPAGDHVARSLLNRLQQQTGIDNLVPLHRLDRDTAGIVLFGLKTESRRHYHALFEKRLIEREYLAVAELRKPPTQRRWTVENRLVSGEPWFRRRVAEDGRANAITTIDLLDTRKSLGLFRLIPRTGRKHQLRVHMSSIGFPILGDVLYPEQSEAEPGDTPLQLLASRLCFNDPLTGLRREFKSSRRLEHAWEPIQ
jgi:tRNA pseudouridine32 synthase / 23S rRNA pseudouridine746 synthase